MLNLAIRILRWERAEVLQTEELASGDFLARKWSSRAASSQEAGGEAKARGWVR